VRLSPALSIDDFVRQGNANWKQPYRLIRLHLQLENLTIIGFCSVRSLGSAALSWKHASQLRVMSVGVLVSSGSILQSVFSEFRIVERVHVEFLFGNAFLGVEISSVRRLMTSVVWHSVLWCSSTLTNEFSRLSKQPSHSHAWWST